MASHSANLDVEPDIWARLIQAQKHDISPEVARYLLSIEFGESDRKRMQYLAERSEAGTLTPDEEAEFDGYLHVGNLLGVMQSQARVVLGEKSSGQQPSPAAFEALALEAYRQRRITGYQLRTLLGISSRLALDRFLQEHGVYDYTFEDFEKDLATIEEYRDKPKAERPA